MRTSSILTRTDYENYLISIYFGSREDLLDGCIQRAYRDFCRILNGMAKFENRLILKDRAIEVFRGDLHNLKTISCESASEQNFDNWHKLICDKLVSLFDFYHFPIRVGHAQKWVNMTMKYIFTMGEERLTGFHDAYQFCHAPLDNIFLNQLYKYGLPKFKFVWSHIDDYNEYLNIQNWIRQRFDYSPLDVEFFLWLGKEI